jgi:hypothetical protein
MSMFFKKSFCIIRREGFYFNLPTIFKWLFNKDKISYGELLAWNLQISYMSEFVYILQQILYKSLCDFTCNKHSMQYISGKMHIKGWIKSISKQ